MKKLKTQYILYLFAILLFSNCTDSNDNNEGYDPNKKIKLLSFEPDTGRIASQVLLDGENFGNDPSLMKVYFNDKQAAVIGIKDGTAYVLTPRLPGDTCKISVVIGKDSTAYENEFYYTTSYNVSTIVGKDTQTNVTTVGEFGDVEFGPEVAFVHVDYNNAYFLSTRHGETDLGQTTIMQVDPEAGVVRDLWPASMRRSGNRIMSTDPRTGITYSPDRASEVIFELDPDNLYVVKRKYINHPSEEQVKNENYVDWSWSGDSKHSLGFCWYDNFFYTRTGRGNIIKWDPLGSNVGTLVANTGADLGDGGYMAFSPLPEESHIMYFAVPGRHAIYTWDVSKPDQPIEKLCGVGQGTGGHRDGVFADAEFKNPRQICFDHDGLTIYVADAGNHCIRKIDLKNKLVSTIAGQPGEAGLEDGTIEETKFREPHGVSVDMDGYILVMDLGNRRLRKLAIE